MLHRRSIAPRKSVVHLTTRLVGDVTARIFSRRSVGYRTIPGRSVCGSSRRVWQAVERGEASLPPSDRRTTSSKKRTNHSSTTLRIIHHFVRQRQCWSVRSMPVATSSCTCHVLVHVLDLFDGSPCCSTSERGTRGRGRVRGTCVHAERDQQPVDLWREVPAGWRSRNGGRRALGSSRYRGSAATSPERPSGALGSSEHPMEMLRRWR
jgi:hypothetical protein